MDLSALAFEQSVRAFDAALPAAIGEDEIEEIVRRVHAERTGADVRVVHGGTSYRVMFSRYVEPSTQGDFIAVSAVAPI